MEVLTAEVSEFEETEDFESNSFDSDDDDDFSKKAAASYEDDND